MANTKWCDDPVNTVHELAILKNTFMHFKIQISTMTKSLLTITASALYIQSPCECTCVPVCYQLVKNKDGAYGGRVAVNRFRNVVIEG